MKLFKNNNQEHINSSVTNEEGSIAIVLKQKVLLKIVLLMKWKNLLLKKQWNLAKNKQLKRTIRRDVSNDLKEFGVDSDAPDLFSSETENSSSDDLLSSSDEEDDDLEIPAFLRRQKN